MNILKIPFIKILNFLTNKFFIARFLHYLRYRFIFINWLKGFGTSSKINSISKGNIIVSLSETQHSIFIPLLILAKALELRGFNIIIFVCDGFLKACEIKSSKNIKDNKPCWHCKFNIKNIISKFNFEMVSYTSLFSEGEISLINQKIIERNYADLHLDDYLDDSLELSVNDSVIRYFYGDVDTTKASEVKNNNIQTAIFSYLAAKRLDKNYNPLSVISAMSAYSQWNAFYHYFTKSNRFKKVSLSSFNLSSLLVNDFELYSNTDRFKKYKDLKRNKLSISDNKELFKFLKTRFKGKSEIFVRDGYFQDSENNSTITVDPKKKNIFLFTNIYWDVGVSESGYLYNDVIEWVFDTIDLVSDRSDINLFIKPHPGELFDSSTSLKTISDFIDERYSELPNNVQIIYPEQKINTYDLFDFIDLGLIYNGTIGLEMMLNDIPVISTGKTTYQNLNFAMHPKTVKDYLDLILRESYKKPSKSDLYFYAYFYFLKTTIPFDLSTTYNASFAEIPKLESFDELSPGKSIMIDHFCKCLTEEGFLPESW